MKHQSKKDRAFPLIISGGQTGADRAALEWAVENGVPCKGWCPAGRKAEDGALPPGAFSLQETPSGDYRQRTRWNVRDTDATVVFTLAAELTGGSLLTQIFARKEGKPCLHLSRAASSDPADELTTWIRLNHVRSLNVAGPRASNEPEIGAFVREVLAAASALWL